jgi:hypothetical protein
MVSHSLAFIENKFDNRALDESFNTACVRVRLCVCVYGSERDQNQPHYKKMNEDMERDPLDVNYEINADQTNR